MPTSPGPASITRNSRIPAAFASCFPSWRASEVRERLKAIWLDPLSLDPTRHAARVTREIAARLALLGRSLEKDGHSPERVAAVSNARSVYDVCR